MNRLTTEQCQWLIEKIEAAQPIFSIVKDPTLDLNKYCFLMLIEQIINQAADNGTNPPAEE